MAAAQSSTAAHVVMQEIWLDLRAFSEARVETSFFVEATPVSG
jgi:hypothetical protein